MMSRIVPEGRLGDLVVGLAIIVGVCVTCALVFGVRLPFGGTPFEFQADFSTAAQIRSGSPVRLGGVDVGRVTAIERHGNRARLTLRIDHRAEAIHADAQLAIKPRLALGGNDYVELSLGTPAAPPMRAGGLVPRSRTSVAVDLDQVLDVFDVPARDALKRSLGALATGLASRPPGGRSGAQGLRRATRELDGALTSVTQVASAARGEHAGDLRRAVRSTGDVTAQLARDPVALAALVHNYDRVFAALASRDAELAASVREVAELTTSGPGALAAIDRALPPVRRLALSLQPALRAAPEALSSASRALTQLTGLVGPAELKGLLADVRPATLDARAAVSRSTDLLTQVLPVARCLRTVVLPTLEAKVPDGKHSSGRPVWQDMLHAGANLASFSNSFDGNGTTIRAETSQSELPLTTQLPGGTKLYGEGDVIGVAPQYLQHVSDIQFRPDQPCSEQQPPDLGKRRSEGMPAGLTRASTAPPARSRLGLLRALLRRDPRAALRALDKLVPGARERPGRRNPGPRPHEKPHRRPATAPGRVPQLEPDRLPPSVGAPQVGDVAPETIREPAQALADEVRRLGGGLLGSLSGKPPRG